MTLATAYRMPGWTRMSSVSRWTPLNNDRDGFMMVTTPEGGQRDIQFLNEGRDVNFAWVGTWQVEARIHENGWTAEFAIPFETLSSSKESFDVWGINFFRLIRRRNESTWWSPVPRRYGYFQISRAGELIALEGVQQGVVRRRNGAAWRSPVPPRDGYLQISRAGQLKALQGQPQERGGQTETEGPERNLRVRLSSLAGTNEFRSQGLAPEAVFVGSVDLKYSVTSDLTLDLTLNPDFSYVEVDVKKKVSLTTFPDSFPEKRGFFVKNAGAFSVGGDLPRGASQKARSQPFQESKHRALSQRRTCSHLGRCAAHKPDGALLPRIHERSDQG